MLVTNTTDTIAQSLTQDSARSNAAPVDDGAPGVDASAPPTDSVSLSAAAQQVLADGTAAPTDSSSDTAPVTSNPTLAAALKAVNDDSGRTSVQDQLAAYDTLSAYEANGTDDSPERDAVLQSFDASPFAKHVAQVNDLVNGPVFTADVGGALLDRINRLTPDDQQIAFHLQDQQTPDAFMSLDSLKANDAARSAVAQITQKIFKKFGGDDLTTLTDPRPTTNAAFQAFLTLTSEDPQSDGWTAEANKVLGDLQKTLDLVPDDPHAKDAAQAIATLKAPRPITVGQAAALKGFKHIQDQLQKARDDAAAKQAGQPQKTLADAAKSKAADKDVLAGTTIVAPKPLLSPAVQAVIAAVISPGAVVDTAA